MNPNTEQNLILNAAKGLMANDETKFDLTHQAGSYAAATRVLVCDFGQVDVGPIIGGAGAMKLAIQTMVACPFGGDSCRLQIVSTREHSTRVAGDPSHLTARIERFLDATKQHYRGTVFHYRVEEAQTATVVIVETSPLFTQAIRGALSKILRSIGKKHNRVVVTSIENHEPV